MGGAALEAAQALENANPIELGRASRRAVEEAWQVFASLSSPIRPANLDGLEDSLAAESADGAAADFCALGTPEAGRHRVLVAGATGRVGRVVCNKLLLCGYKVRALVRRVDEESLAKLPAAVEGVEGEVQGVRNLAEALMTHKNVMQMRLRDEASLSQGIAEMGPGSDAAGGIAEMGPGSDA